MRTLVRQSADLSRWDHKHFAAPTFRIDRTGRTTFGHVAKIRSEAAGSDTPLGSVHFDGSMSVRAPGKPIKGKVFRAEPGNLVVSRIDARNGAIAVVPDNLGPLAFTSEYYIYELESLERAIPRFAALILRSPSVQRALESASAGHSGRRRVTRADVESVAFPSVDLGQQRSLLAAYDDAIRRAQALRDAAPGAVEDALATALAHSGLAAPSELAHRGPFVVDSSSLTTWSVRQALSQAQATTAPHGEVVSLGSPGVAQVLRGVSKSPRNRPAQHARPYVRVANLRPGWVDLSDVRRIDVPPTKLPGLELHDGDLLVCRNNSLELVGKSAVWRSEQKGWTHDDHVLRVRMVSGSPVDVGYVSALVNGPFGQVWFRERAQITTNLAGIPASAIRDFPVPVLDFDQQVEIGRQYESAVVASHRAAEDATALEAEAWEEFLHAVGEDGFGQQ